ncbi:MAG TPA: hypothetical protein VGQ16_18415 [Vicinamibacterales bacterium]|nr:hypothetical protein [Vicinamibacterales bacterium]
MTTIVNADEVINQVPVADIAQRFAPGPARVSITASRIVIGIKVTR